MRNTWGRKISSTPCCTEIQDRAVGDLRGKTKTGIRFEFAARIDVRQHHLHAQTGEERRVERKERVGGQRLGDTDARPVRRR